MSAQFGNAVERLVAKEIENDPVLRDMLIHTPNFFKNRPRSIFDFAGIGRGQGLLFDVTTVGEVGVHRAKRYYGDLVEYITYTIQQGFKFP